MSDIQDTILEAVDYICEKRIESAGLDKTVVVTIEKCEDAVLGKYLVKYTGGKTYAYANGDKVYAENQSVYMLIPKGDFSNKKIILDTALTTGKGVSDVYVTNMLNGMNEIGSNVVKTLSTRTWLFSNKGNDSMVLYDANKPNGENKLSIDATSFMQNMKTATALLVKLKVNTASVPRAQRLAAKGVYGIKIIFKLKSGGTYPFIFNSSNMLGNPYLYTSWASQYDICDIANLDIESIQEIRVESSQFNISEITSEDGDILFKDIEIVALQNISDESQRGDYRLILRSKNGNVFGKNDNSQLNFEIRLLYKQATVTNNAKKIYWFIEDPLVNSSIHKDYHRFGGKGWRLISDSRALTLNKSETKSSITQYKVVCEYSDYFTLSSAFSVENPASLHELKITSNATSFDNIDDIAKMTLEIDGGTAPVIDFNDESEAKERYTKDEFSVIWSVREAESCFVFDPKVSLEELQEKSKDMSLDRAERSVINEQIEAQTGVDVGVTYFNYPMKKVKSAATVTAMLYIGDKVYAQVSIVVARDSSIASMSSYAYIENGSQVFKYDENGVAPTSQRNQDPQVELPLRVKFFNNAGTEVNVDDYTWRWLVPSKNSLIKPFADATPYENNPDYSVILGKGQADDGLSFSISDIYNYTSTNNQIIVEVVYNGVKYRNSTEFIFSKTGEGGTSSQNVVGRVIVDNYANAPMFEPDGDTTIPYSLVKDLAFESGRKVSLSLKAFEGAEDVTKAANVSWGFAGAEMGSKFLVESNNRINTPSIDVKKGAAAIEDFQSAIVEAEFSFSGSPSEKYYAFAPLVTYHRAVSDAGSPILYSARTIKEITYNSAGRLPRFNTNQGIHVGWLLDGRDVLSSQDYSVEFGAGGVVSISTKDATKSFRKIEAASVYNGLSTRNFMKATFKRGDTVLGVLYVPVHVSFNRYELQSVNGWDGTSLEVNEDGAYIVAPQIGAGSKSEKDGSFTGIVMGTEQTWTGGNNYDTKTGLFGYGNGIRSIFIDSESGRAEFGTPSSSSGRIIINPEGASSIGSWFIGNGQLYSMSRNGKYFEADKSAKTYTDYPVIGSSFGVPYDAQGIVLGSNPTYLSIKGAPFVKGQSGIDLEEAIVSEGESFEVEIDPAKSSLFTIYRHHMNGSTHRRTPVVGINAKGNFYTGALSSDGLELDMYNEGDDDYGVITSRGNDVFFKYYTGRKKPLCIEAPERGINIKADNFSVTTSSQVLEIDDNLFVGIDNDLRKQYFNVLYNKTARTGTLKAVYENTDAVINIDGSMTTVINGKNKLTVKSQDTTVSGGSYSTHIASGNWLTTINGASSEFMVKMENGFQLSGGAGYFRSYTSKSHLILSDVEGASLKSTAGGVSILSSGVNGEIDIAVLKDAAAPTSIKIGVYGDEGKTSASGLVNEFHWEASDAQKYFAWSHPGGITMKFGAKVTDGDDGNFNNYGLQVNPGIRTKYLNLEGPSNNVNDGYALRVKSGKVGFNDGVFVDKIDVTNTVKALTMEFYEPNKNSETLTRSDVAEMKQVSNSWSGTIASINNSLSSKASASSVTTVNDRVTDLQDSLSKYALSTSVQERAHKTTKTIGNIEWVEQTTVKGLESVCKGALRQIKSMLEDMNRAG